VSDGTVPLLSFDVSYNTPGTRTFTIQAADNHGGACIIASGNAGTGLSWKIYRFPTREEQVLRHDQVAWRVDANIGGANPSLGAGNVSDYTEITNGSLDLVNNSGPGVIPAQIPCSGTNPPTGLTCSAGNESVGVSFNLPAAGSVTACASFTHDTSIGVSSSSSATFQIVETPNNAQTILQEGKERVTSGSTTNSTNGNILRLPRKVCGNFDFTSTGQKTLRLMYEQVSTGTINHALILGDRDTSFGQRDIKWEVYPRNTSQPAPLLVGSVISGSSGIERVERATINITSNTSAVIERQSGNWLSIGSVSGAVVIADIASGTFSSAPTCNITCNNAQINSIGMVSGGDVAQTSVNFVCVNLSGNPISGSLVRAQVVCIGPR
jgi:hypothetical protein